MKQRILILAMSGLLTTLVGCSSTPKSVSSGAMIEPGGTSGTAIADQRLAVSEFKKDGVKLIYSLTGSLEGVEVTGYASSWGSSHHSAREAFRVAELEAKKSLSDFIHKETVSSKTSVVMISENLEHAKDNNTNKFASNKPSNELVAVDDSAETKAAVDSNSVENQAVRNNALRIASQLRTTIVTTNRGIISGLYLKESSVIDDGKAVKVVMRWDKKNNPTRLEIGRLMSM